jgi:hypothetical protein|nr:MAG TPA: hypothetical protein [Caudoviricetes sp.]
MTKITISVDSLEELSRHVDTSAVEFKAKLREAVTKTVTAGISSQVAKDVAELVAEEMRACADREFGGGEWKHAVYISVDDEWVSDDDCVPVIRVDHLGESIVNELIPKIIRQLESEIRYTVEKIVTKYLDSKLEETVISNAKESVRNYIGGLVKSRCDSALQSTVKLAFDQVLKDLKNQNEQAGKREELHNE